MRARSSNLVLAVALLSAFAAHARTLHLIPGESAVKIHVGKSGPFAGLAHEHDVSAPAFAGEVTLDADALNGGAVSVTFDARKMLVAPQHEPGDAPKVQATMLGPQVLDTARYPSIRFTSSRVSSRQVDPNVYRVDVTGQLELHGVKRSVTLPLLVELRGERLVATGQVALRQTEFGITPIRLAAGAVTVPDEITVQLRLVAREAP
jgi:polyisoprenoid-binding protein YceI